MSTLGDGRQPEGFSSVRNGNRNSTRKSSAARDGWQLRNDIIPLRTPAEGYAHVLFLGTTGAGKTTLARQMIVRA